LASTRIPMPDTPAVTPISGHRHHGHDHRGTSPPATTTPTTRTLTTGCLPNDPG
jgi:hypothetical protein